MTQKEDEYNALVLELDAWKAAATELVDSRIMGGDGVWRIEPDKFHALRVLVDTL